MKSADAELDYRALVHVRVRYGTFGIMRMDLKVGTNADGKTTITGLPDKARLLTVEVKEDDKKMAIVQAVETTWGSRRS